MLIRFNVKNFLSFFETSDGKSIEFSMIAGKVRNKKEHVYDDGKIKLLKLATIYGANASGKSNFVKAVSFMRDVVLEGLPHGHTEKYCKIAPENRKKPSYFEVELKIDDHYYSYGFEVVLDQSRFVSEWLVELVPDRGDTKEDPLFYRDVEKKELEFGSDLRKGALKRKLDVYAEDIRDESGVLFLNIMNQNKSALYRNNGRIKVLQSVYRWFAKGLDVHFPDRPISDYGYLTSKKNNVEDICRMISAFGTGIKSYAMVDVPLERVLEGLSAKIRGEIRKDIEESLIRVKDSKDNMAINLVMRSNRNFFIISLGTTQDLTCKTIRFVHESSEASFELYEESDGTVRILDLLEVLLSDEENKTYVIDELDRCLHPRLTYQFIRSYLNLVADYKKKVQLIVTTHESRLLDLDLLRRDEIWFVDKDYTGSSEMYSLEEYNTRFDLKIDKAYLEGRYGAVPIFDTLIPVE